MTEQPEMPTEDQTVPDTPSAVSETKTISSGTVSHLIIRGCTRCQGQRVIGEPCATCGNPEPPEVTKLGVVSATYRNPIKRAWWTLVRAPMAERRIRRAAARTLELRRGD